MIRYPGSKAAICHRFWLRFTPAFLGPLFTTSVKCYCEPFFGSGAMGWRVLEHLSPGTRVILNDLDNWLICMWAAVRDTPELLIERIKEFEPSAEAFYQFKAQKERNDQTIPKHERGFRNLVLHQTSFSGLGVMAGGPLGGKEGNSEYQPGCRWNPQRLIATIQDRHLLLLKFKRQVEFYSRDFAEVLRAVPPDESSFVYLDPPYYEKGPELYFHSFKDEDHHRLASQLREAKFRFLLTYDDHQAIRDLYPWAHIESFTMTPTVQTKRGGKRRKNSELTICNYE